VQQGLSATVAFCAAPKKIDMQRSFFPADNTREIIIPYLTRAPASGVEENESEGQNRCVRWIDSEKQGSFC
jgi:hypothetical protein